MNWLSPAHPNRVVILGMAPMFPLIAVAAFVLWGFGAILHVDETVDLPVVSIGSFGFREYGSAVVRMRTDRLYAASLVGHPVAFDADVQGAPRDVDGVLSVDLGVGDDSFVSGMAVAHLTCAFEHPSSAAPLSSWHHGQRVWLTGRIGAAPGAIEGCVMAAYVYEASKLSPDGNVRLANSSHLEPSQVYPPGSALPRLETRRTWW